MLEQKLTERIRTRELRIGILGLGYVGLPLAMLFNCAGFTVIGFDVNERYIEQLLRGRSSVTDVKDETLSEALASGRFYATAEPGELGQADAYIICVPTPLSKTRQPDISYIEAALYTVLQVWRRGKVVVLESTTYPGTTDELLLPLLSEGGLKVDEDFLLAFSSERVDPGNTSHPIETIPKVVGGVSDASTRVAVALYEGVFSSVHPVSNARTAELSKLLENVFRNVNIALANEFKQICDTLDVDVWEVIEAASTKPFGFMPFFPGPGIGGHCIPLDPQYLLYRSRLSGYEPRLVALADQINQAMPLYTVHQVTELLNEQGKALKGSSVFVVGVTYKPNVSDTRESPALQIIEHLRKRGARVRYSDQLVPKLTLASGDELGSVQTSRALLAEADVVVVITAHQSLRLELLNEVRGKVVDTRNVLVRGSSALAIGGE